MPDRTPLLELRAVSKVYGGGFFKKRADVVALDRLSFTLGDDHPTITAIAGESGSGKTTLAHLLLGHIGPTAGQVLYRGQDVSAMRGRERNKPTMRLPAGVVRVPRSWSAAPSIRRPSAIHTSARMPARAGCSGPSSRWL